MAFTPNSEVHLLNVPLENDYKNQIYFANTTLQFNYFKSRAIHSFTDLTYQRKDNIIRVPKHIDELYNCNYVMYKNTRYTNKWFYAFITKMEYISDGCTHVYIETDVYQTWLTEVTLKKSFVEREHVMDDTVGLNTIPESLETGEYICNDIIIDEKGKDLGIVMAFSDFAGSESADVVGNLYGGVYSGMGYTYFSNNLNGILAVNNMLKGFDEGKADAINSLFMIPKWLVGEVSETTVSQLIAPYTEPKSYNVEISKQTTLNGYTPRNKKLLCYPFNYLCVSNNGGGSSIYKYELFNKDQCPFLIKGVLTPGGSIRLTPSHYKGVDKNYDEGINAGKYPICCWNSDAYTNWLTQNGVNIQMSLISGGLQIAAGMGMIASTGFLGSMVGGGSIAGGVSTISNTLAQRYQQSLVPDQVKGNTNCGDVITGAGENCFMFYKMSIKSEFAKIIDEFFDAYGYQINSYKIPNVSGRTHWNYVKTQEVNIDGAIPNEDMQKLKSMYNNGVTFWKSGANVGNYSLDNSI